MRDFAWSNNGPQNIEYRYENFHHPSFDPTGWTCRWTSDSVLFHRRRTVADLTTAGFSLNAWALKPSGFCNLRVYA